MKNLTFVKLDIEVVVLEKKEEVSRVKVNGELEIDIRSMIEDVLSKTEKED